MKAFVRRDFHEMIFNHEDLSRDFSDILIRIIISRLVNGTLDGYRSAARRYISAMFSKRGGGRGGGK